jgi:hypothetical protein
LERLQLGYYRTIKIAAEYSGQQIDY